jgi:hypothetical protein
MILCWRREDCTTDLNNGQQQCSIIWLGVGMDSDVWKSELSVFVSAKNVNMDIRIRIRF